MEIDTTVQRVTDEKPSTKRNLLLPVVLLLVLLIIGTGVMVTRERPLSELRPFLTSDAQVIKQQSLVSNDGEIERYTVTMSRGNAKAWIFPDGSIFWCERSNQPFSLSLNSPGPTEEILLNPKEMRAPRLIQTDDGSMLIQPPLARENVALDGTNYIARNSQNGKVQTASGSVSIQFEGDCADWWVYRSSQQMMQNGSLDWLYRCRAEKFGADNRLTIDGYYYATPLNYEPSGEGYYYRLPAAYIASTLARLSDCTPGHQMAVAMMDIQCEHYKESGYIPTSNTSRWLSNDYEVGSDFFDTRFNTDLGHALLELGQITGIEMFTDYALNYASFLCKHAYHSAEWTQHGGILVDDYAHDAGNLPTLTSLNHQLAEAYFLYETQQQTAIDVANKMLQGIEDTAEHWIRPDHNLHYAYYPDGSFGGTDYPFLTYNDLLNLNAYVGGNSSLERLMASKKTWMDANNITGYNQPI